MQGSASSLRRHDVAERLYADLVAYARPLLEISEAVAFPASCRWSVLEREEFAKRVAGGCFFYLKRYNTAALPVLTQSTTL